MNPGFSDFRKRCQAKTCCNAHEESRARESNIMEIRKKNTINNEDAFYLFSRAFLFTIKAI
jgi:hypothetical protein